MTRDERGQDPGPVPTPAAGGGGAAKGTGYGAGGSGSGGDRASGAPDPWDRPGVTPDGRRTGDDTPYPPQEGGEHGKAPD